jgi:hypothetical protein
MTTQAYESALPDYRKAIDDVRKPAAGAVERGGGGVSPSASEAEPTGSCNAQKSCALCCRGPPPAKISTCANRRPEIAGRRRLRAP